MEENFYNPSYLLEGIYQVKRKSVYPLIEHHGIAVVGKLLEQLEFTDGKARVFHKTNLEIHKDIFNVNEWQRLEFVPTNQATQEIIRLKTALKKPTYDLLSSNCEHFSRFVMEGMAQSAQSQFVGFLTGSALMVWLSRNDYL